MEIGLKVGSQNAVLALRNNGEVEIRETKTCIIYPKDFLSGTNRKPVVGFEATRYVDAIYPLLLGVVEKDEGVGQTADILRSLGIPKGAEVVLASPAVEMLEGKRRLARAVALACGQEHPWVYSEGLCAAVALLGGVDYIQEETFFSVNLGSTTTEFGCFSEGRIAHLGSHADLSGDKVDSAIASRIRNSIGDSLVMIADIREMKEKASLIDPKPFKVKGINRGGIKEHEICKEITISLEEYVDGVARIIKKEITDNIDRDLIELAMEKPLIFSGGMTNIEGLPELITAILNKKMNYIFRGAYSKNKDNHKTAAVGALMLCEALVAEGGEK